MKEVLKAIQSNMDVINNSKIFTGLIMIALNIGSKFITIKLSKSQEEYMKNYVAREVLIFAICWMGTRDVVISLILTFSFYIITEFLFHEESSLCIMPGYLKSIQDSIDLNGDGEISQDEIDQSLKLLSKAKDTHTAKKKQDVYRYFLANKY